MVNFILKQRSRLAGRNVQATGLIALVQDKLIGTYNGKFIEIIPSSNDSFTSIELGDIPENFPGTDYISTTKPLPTNPSIEQTIMISGEENIRKTLLRFGHPILIRTDGTELLIQQDIIVRSWKI